MSNPELPECLTKHGITTVCDNTNGRELQVGGAVISMWMRDDLLRFVKKKRAEREAKISNLVTRD